MAAVLKSVDYVVVVRNALSLAVDRQGAAQLLQKQAERDHDLRDALIEHFRPQLLSQVCVEAIQELAGEVRQVARRAARSDVEARSLSSRVGAIKAMLDLWTLPSGTKLPKATGQDVRDAIAYHRDQRQAHERAIKFYEPIARAVARDVVVETVLSHEELAALLEAAER